MDYRDLKWGELKSFAKSQGINTKGKKKVDILDELDYLNEEIVVRTIKGEPTDDPYIFKAIKQSHPFFEEVEPYIPYLIAYNKIGSVSNIEGVSKGIATIFMKYIETDPNAVVNLKCGRCIPRYYKRLVAGYNRMADEYGRDKI
jgi:hypothetical protein